MTELELRSSIYDSWHKYAFIKHFETIGEMDVALFTLYSDEELEYMLSAPDKDNGTLEFVLKPRVESYIVERILLCPTIQ